MSFTSSIMAKANAAASKKATSQTTKTAVVTNPLVSAINRAVSASKSAMAFPKTKSAIQSNNPVSAAIKKSAVNSGTGTVYTLEPKILTPQSGAVAGVSDKVTTLSPKILTTDKTSTPTISKGSEILDDISRKKNIAKGKALAKKQLAENAVSKASEIEDEIRRKKIIAEGKALAEKQLAEKVSSNNANAVAKESTNTEQASVVSPSVIPGVDYKSLMDKAVAQQQRNAAVNTAQTRNLAQEQAYQAGAKVGSADAANYVNRAMAQADAANVAGAQGLQDSLLSYQKSAESQQNWQKQFDQSSKQADIANERARYDQIVSAIGSDNPDALSYFAKQYLGGVPIDKAYSDTLTKGFKPKTAKDMAYEELATWQPEIEEYLKIQKEQGQVAADNYLKSHPIPTEHIPTNTASDAAVQSSSIVGVNDWVKSLSSGNKNAFKYPPIQDISLAIQSGNKDVLKKVDSISIAIGGEPGSKEFYDEWHKKYVDGDFSSSNKPLIKGSDGQYYYASVTSGGWVFKNLNTGVPVVVKSYTTGEYRE